MDNFLKTFAAYYCPPENYFWHWADDGSVLEWYDGTTLLYRNDLQNILRALVDMQVGLPRFGSLLLTLAACSEHWKQAEYMDKLVPFFTHTEDGKQDNHKKYLETYLHMAKRFLNAVNDLPRDLRSGPRRVLLVRTVFENQAPFVSAEEARSMVDEFWSRQADFSIANQFRGDRHFILSDDLRPFFVAWQKMPSASSLEQKIRTGLSELPAPVELPLPEETPPDLWADLASDSRTAGLARLAQRLIAALQIPMHAQGAGDLPLGGISDLSNRGDFDRLLLSELAQDDLTLTARLVNNEALFFRREEPPVHHERQRTILLDTSLKMWGVPRVFALAAALACARETKAVKKIGAAALVDGAAIPLDLSSKTGLLAALEHLDPALHCADALSNYFFDNTHLIDNEDVILISDDEAMRDEAFQAVFSKIKNRLRFLVALNRDGSLRFFEFIAGRMKLLGKPRFDLKELLFSQEKNHHKQSSEKAPSALPAFLLQKPAPLFFPSVHIDSNSGRFWYQKSLGAVVVTPNRRLLFWSPDGKTGARELLPYVENGQYFFSANAEIVYLLVWNAKLCLHQIFINFGHVKNFNINFEKNELIRNIFFEKDVFNVLYSIPYDSTYVVRINMDTGEEMERQKVDLGFEFPKKEASNFFGFQSMTLPQQAIFQKIKNVYLHKGDLAVNYVQLRCAGDQIFWAGLDEQPVRTHKMDVNFLLPNKKVAFYTRQWSETLRIVGDERGILHLCPTDLPEVSILLVHGATAAWASDGHSCGPDYFTGNSRQAGYLPADVFYKTYIEPILKKMA